MTALLATAVAAVTVVVADADEATASELTAFSSCDELTEWAETAAVSGVGGGGAARGVEDDSATGSAPVTTTAAAPQELAADTAAGGSATGQTNVAVEGVDELDLVDRISDDRALVVAGDRLSLVDLTARAVVDAVPAAYDSRITYDPDAGLAWVTGSDPTTGATTVGRVRVDGDTLVPDGEWTASGYLVDARRTGDRLHVVATEGIGVMARDTGVPFQGGPVPCDQVLHPIGPSSPEATLLVTLPATGALEPVHAAEVVGAGQFVHVTRDAAYLATPLWSEQPETSIHRFDLETLTHTGSGRLAGTLLNQFSMSEHDGHLRVAVSHAGTFTGGPRPLDDIATTAAPPLPAEDPLAEVVVLDTDGDLDVTGRTARFGHAGETIHGIRFVGDVGYAVTFRTTDPFFVLDLADPAAPAVVGEVELPGFSAYLHPVGPGLVAGFGPDGDATGGVSVKLFDVSDPTAPRVADTERLGDDSPVAWDHHALVALDGGRVAVPATTWRAVEPEGCSPEGRELLMAESGRLEEELSALYNQPAPDQARIDQLSRQLEAIWSNPCMSPQQVADTHVVVLDTAGGAIDVLDRTTFTAAELGVRLLPTGDAWAVLAGTHLVVVGDGGVEADLTLA
jgi:uncharacterized secreted protein with C-terminal beta-propeller domain